MRLSVIIPIYKAEKYIERCIRSLMEQTMRIDIEFIFINDCTPDSSMLILMTVLDEYPDRQPQVKILNNERNIGPHETRMRGINEASGEYIGFCDADDWVEFDMYKKLYDATLDKTIDVVVSNFLLETSQGSSVFEIQCSKKPHDALANMNDSHIFSWSMCNQIIRRRIVSQEIDNIYPTRFREDTYLAMRCYYKAQSIAYIPRAFYHYNRLLSDSISTQRNCSIEEWYEQKENLDRIANLLYQEPNGYEKFHYGVNNFKFMIKDEFMNAFSTDKEYYYAFRECHQDAMKKYFQPGHTIIEGIKMWIYYCTTYSIFDLYKKLNAIKER